MPNQIDLKNLKQKNALIEALPWIGRGTCTAIYPNVYLTKAVYLDIQQDNPDPYNVSRIIHEQEHITRMKQHGVAKWYLRYLLSRKFRFEEELAAITPQLAFIKHPRLTFNLERTARSLSGWLYLWATNYDHALKRLIAIWKEA